LKDAALLHHSQDQDQGEPQAGTVLLQWFEDRQKCGWEKRNQKLNFGLRNRLSVIKLSVVWVFCYVWTSFGLCFSRRVLVGVFLLCRWNPGWRHSPVCLLHQMVFWCFC
jgi:hypothetical protein